MTRYLTVEEIQDILKEIIIPKYDDDDECRNELQKHFQENIKRQLLNVKIYPEILDEYKKRIIQELYKSLVSPGETVGVITGQSIGELGTQMSVDYNTGVYIYKDKKINNFQIGDFIENILNIVDANANADSDAYTPENIQYFQDTDTTVCDVSNYNYYTPALNSNEICEWAKIQTVVKHPANGNLIKVKTNDGRTVIASKSYSFITRYCNMIIPKRGNQLEIGNYIPIFLGWEEDDVVNSKLATFDENSTLELQIVEIFSLLINQNEYITETTIDETIINNGYQYNYKSSLLIFNTIKVVCEKKNINCKYKYIYDYIIYILLQLNIDFNTNEDEYILRIKKEVYFIPSVLYPNGTYHDLLEYGVYKQDFNKTNIKWERIVHLEYIESSNYYVYDFSIPGYDTFMISNGIIQKNTLNSFHSAGMTSKHMEMGIPRLVEILNTSKNIKTPTCNIYFQTPKTEKELWDIGGKLVETFLSDLVFKDYIIDDDLDTDWWHILYCKMCCDLNIEKTYSWGPRYFLMNSSLTKRYKYKDLCLYSPWVLRLKLDVTKLVERKISLEQICKLIELAWPEQLLCIASPLHLGIIDIIPECKHVTINDIPYSFLNNYNIVQYYIKNIIVPNILTLNISGITNIKKIYVTQDLKTKEWFIQTNNGDLKQILLIPDIDTTRTSSNNLRQIFEVFGIEALRSFLFDELNKVINSEGPSVNKRHISILCDYMTRVGKPTAVTSTGFSKTDDEGEQQLRDSTFEKSMDKLLETGAYGICEDTTAVSSCIIIGKHPKIGTYMSDIMVDLEVNNKLYNELYNNNEILFNCNNNPNSISDNPVAEKNIKDTPTHQPKSPDYQATHHTKSPEYQATHHNKSPEYQPKSPVYQATQQTNSPTYQPVYQAKSPEYQPEYQPKSPEYQATHQTNSPVYQATHQAKSPEYQATHQAKSPEYQAKLPIYQAKSPEYTPS